MKTTFLFLLLLFSINPLIASDSTIIARFEQQLKRNEKTLNDVNATNQANSDRLSAFDKRLDFMSYFFYGFGGLLAIVLAAGSLTSFLNWKTERKRAKEDYEFARGRENEVASREKILSQRQDEMYAFMFAKEKTLASRQDEMYGFMFEREKTIAQRDESIFKSSSDTLTLVNDTLTLAKDASERASLSLKRRFDSSHEELENRSKELIEEDSKAYKNYKNLVENAGFRSTIMTLDLEIMALKNYQLFLDESIQLKPFTSFIHAMRFHLSQDFKDAIKYWKQVKDHVDANKQLKIMTLFWIGYEYNNMMEFEKATASFEEAKELAEGAQKYEQERMLIESKFFDIKKFKTDQIVLELKSLKERILAQPDTEDYNKIKGKILGTLGNVLIQYANEFRKEGNLENAYENYKNAFDAFNSAPSKDKWIYFGIGEALYRMGKKEEAIEIFEKNVLEAAEKEYTGRVEPRSKVLGQTTQLICSIWIKSRNVNVIALRNSIIQAVGDVDDRFSVYTQTQRRNVSKADFIDNALPEIMSEFQEDSQAT